MSHTDVQKQSLFDSPSVRLLPIYSIVVVGAIAGFWVICHLGRELTPAGTVVEEAHPVTRAAQEHALLHVIVALIAVIVTGRILAFFLRRINQPAVIGEVVAGILLGPSLLGWLAPGAANFILPTSVAPYLGVISQIAVILYMFLVGLEFDAATLEKRGHATTAISHFSIVVPFLLGGLLALWLYPTMSPSGVRFDAFALFFGISLSVTAFPVLARILTDRGIQKTPLGVVALACAAADDVTAWCLLAFVVAVAKAQSVDLLWVLIAPLAYLLTMFFVVRPVVVRLVRSRAAQELNQNILAAVFVALLLSSLTTEWIGIHAIFGAFVLGALVPHDCTIARELPEKLQNVIAVLLLPAFFAFTGMRTQIGLVSGWEGWLTCGVIIVAATLGKFGGAILAARVTGIGWRGSFALGALMNTRGLMELIVLNIGLDLGVIPPSLFAMLVIMALVTTFATSPALRLTMGREMKGVDLAMEGEKVGGDPVPANR